MSIDLGDRKLSQINFLARTTLAFIFFYHGLIPKILFPSEIEVMLVNQHNLPMDALLFSQMAGILEMVLACLIMIMRFSIWPVYIAMFLLVFLLIDVAIMMPELLVEAFNPVSINTAALMLGMIVVISQVSKKSKY